MINISSTLTETYLDKIDHMFDWDMDGSLYSSLIVMLILLILGIIVGISARHALKHKTYIKRPKGILFFGEWYCEMCDRFAFDDMGEEHVLWGGYFFTLFAYLFIAFNWGLLGLPTVIDWLAAPLSLSIIMFVLIQAVAIRYQHFHYFHRYVEPFAIALPINLVTMWSPLISTTMRMFGNCLAGTIMVGLVQWALSLASNSFFAAVGVSGVIGTSAYWSQFPSWTGLFLAPIPMGILNLYFDLFSGFVQTVVFGSLNALWIAQEMPADDSPAIAKASRSETAAVGE